MDWADTSRAIKAIKAAVDQADVEWAEDAYARLLGLRVTARIHPDVSELVNGRMTAIMGALRPDQVMLVLAAAIRSASMMYEERSPAVVHRQADNIARALREAQDAGVA